MILEEVKRIIIESIDNDYNLKGYVSSDTILELANNYSLQLDEIDKLIEFLLNRNYIIKDDEKSINNNEEETQNDYSRIDYNELYKKVEEIDPSLINYLKVLRQISPPQANEVTSLILQAKHDNQYARSRIISMYLRVVVKIAFWYFEKYQFPLAETIQDGNMGLVVALDKFPLDSTDSFIAYASWWIRQHIERGVYCICPLHIPEHIKAKLLKIQELMSKHDFDFIYSDHNSFITKIVDTLSMDYNSAKKYLSIMQSHYSIEEIIEDESCETMLFNDNLELFENYLEYLDSQSLRNLIDEIFNTLKKYESKILSLRFGFYDGEEKTLEEIGGVFKLTRERIRQIEDKALRRLRHPDRSKRLKPYYINHF